MKDFYTLPFRNIQDSPSSVYLPRKASLKDSSAFFMFSKLHNSTISAILSAEQSTSKNSANCFTNLGVSVSRPSYVKTMWGVLGLSLKNLVNFFKYLKYSFVPEKQNCSYLSFTFGQDIRLFVNEVQAIQLVFVKLNVY